MDLFVLDSEMRRIAIFDLYESLIWTDRYRAYGDFELVIPSTLNARNLLTKGTRLAISGSTRVMTVETVLDKKDSDGRALLNITGPSLEDILNDRVAINLTPNADVKDLNWYFTDQLPAEIIRSIFDYVVADGTVSIYDKIPLYTPGNFYPPDTIAEPSTPVTINIPPMPLYDAIQQLCDVYDLGFRLVRNGDYGEIMFNIYSGSDRTTLQTLNAPVIFSPELDNLFNVAYLTSVAAYKNVAHVISPDGITFVYADGVDPDVEGFERKVLFVDASNTRYLDRSTLFPENYTITPDQLDALFEAKDITSISAPQIDSIERLIRMKQIDATDITNINAAIATTFGITSGQTTSLTSLRAVSGITEDQKEAIDKLLALTRLDASGKRAIGLIQSQSGPTTAQKTNVKAVMDAQDVHVSPAEKTLIETARDNSITYNTGIVGYFVSNTHSAAIREAQDLASTTELQSASLNKLARMERLLDTDIANINAAIVDTYILTGSEITILLQVRDNYNSITEDQKDAIDSLLKKRRLTSTEVNSIENIISNNKWVTILQKNTLKAVMLRQTLYISAYEKDLILDAITSSVAFNPTEDATLLTSLTQRGKEELAKNTSLSAFDGEISKYTKSVYEQDFFLGDLVEIRDSDKVSQQMRISEYIHVSDAEGDRAYPTLTVKQLITPGSWATWPFAQVWDDLTTQTWNTV